MTSAIVPIALATPAPILRRVFVLEHRLHQLQDKADQERTTTLALAAVGLCLGYPCPDGDLDAIAARVAETLLPALSLAGVLGPITQNAYHLCLHGTPLPAPAPAPAAVPVSRSTSPEPPAQTEAQGTASSPSGGAHPSRPPLPLPGPSFALRRLYHLAARLSATPEDISAYLQAHAAQEG